MHRTVLQMENMEKPGLMAGEKTEKGECAAEAL